MHYRARRVPQGRIRPARMASAAIPTSNRSTWLLHDACSHNMHLHELAYVEGGSTVARRSRTMKIAISGAGIAGPAFAYWMHRAATR